MLSEAGVFPHIKLDEVKGEQQNHRISNFESSSGGQVSKGGIVRAEQAIAPRFA